jgi:hypothetical protein
LLMSLSFYKYLIYTWWSVLLNLTLTKWLPAWNIGVVRQGTHTYFRSFYVSHSSAIPSAAPHMTSNLLLFWASTNFIWIIVINSRHDQFTSTLWLVRHSCHLFFSMLMQVTWSLEFMSTWERLLRTDAALTQPLCMCLAGFPLIYVHFFLKGAFFYYVSS